MNTRLVDGRRHSHHHVLEATLIAVDIAASGERKLLAAHSSLDHLHSVVGRALERAAATKLDDVGTTLDGVVLDLLPALLRETHLREGLAVDLHLGSEDSHLLAVATIGVSTRDLVLLHAKLEGESLLQTRRVESSERSQLVGLQARVDESGRPG